MTRVETIPLPRERIEEEEEFQVRVTDLAAWPDQEIICRFSYNDVMKRWTWELETLEEGVVIPRSKVVLGRYYQYWPYMAVVFHDRHGEEDHVSTTNLGEEVALTILPGPLGGGFPEEADLSPEEEDQLLKRHWFDPVG